jgi:hypothetical protein
MLPIFPVFEPLALGHKLAIEKLAARFPPYSDFNYTSLWSWNTKGTAAVSNLHGNLVIRFSDYLTSEPFFSFFGDAATAETARTLLELAEGEGGSAHLKLVPEHFASGLSGEDFTITEDRDNHDYLLDVARLASYEGSELKPHRNLVTKFNRLHQAETRRLDLSDLATRETLTGFFLDWAKKKGQPWPDTANEAAAFARVFELAQNDRLIALGIFVGGELAGFTVSERLHGEHGMIHFEKADPKRFAGIYQYLTQETAKTLLSAGCTSLNYQQDLGLSGLRQYKSGYKPTGFLRKFRVTWKDGS